MAALSTQVYAKELQAQVQKNTANANKAVKTSPVQAPSATQAYPEISKLIEYNHCAEADVKIRQLLNMKPNDINLLALRAVSLAKQFKLDPAQKELDKLLKQYPKILHCIMHKVLCFFREQHHRMLITLKIQED